VLATQLKAAILALPTRLPWPPFAISGDRAF
jgi:hypothetical protein